MILAEKNKLRQKFPLGIIGNYSYNQVTQPQSTTLIQPDFDNSYSDYKPNRKLDHQIMGKKRRYGLVSKSTSYCGCPVKKDNITLVTDGKGNSKILGVSSCKNIYQCNICNKRILDRRQRELEIINKEHLKTGGFVYLLTLTVSHSKSDLFKDLLGSSSTKTGILGAYAEIIGNNRNYKKLLAEFGIVMTCRAFETTYGQNGFHAHIHSLLYVDRELTQVELNNLKKEYYSLWCKHTKKAGLKTPDFQHGIDIQNGTNAGSYIAKWSSSNELSSPFQKKCKNGNYSINQLESFLINPIDSLPVDKVKHILRSYYEGCKGKRFLTWSNSKLKRKYLALNNESEKTESQIVEESNIEDNQEMLLSAKDYLKLYKNGKIHELRSSIELNSFIGLISLATSFNLNLNNIHCVSNKLMSEETKLKRIDYLISNYGFFPEYQDIFQRDYFILNFDKLFTIAFDYYSGSLPTVNNGIYLFYTLEFCNQFYNQIILNSLNDKYPK